MDSKIGNDITSSLFERFKKNKLLVIYLAIILILGIYLRFDDYGAEGYSSDCVNTIPAAVFAYYPHDYFPGLVSTEPPLGNYIIGLGCIASGEDFSQVKNVKPLFFPDRSAYLGGAAKNAETYCSIPIYIFGILFLIGIVIFAFSFFNSLNSVFYFIAFFSFSSLIILIGRGVHVDIFLLTFLIFALLFLWKAYKSKKGVIKEKLYFAVSFCFFGLAGATKFTAGVYVIFAFFLLLEKYVYELLYSARNLLKTAGLETLSNKLNGIKNTNVKPFFQNFLISLISFMFFFMMFFNFSIKNLKDTQYYLTSLNNPEIANISLSLNSFIRWFQHSLLKLNIFDFFVFLFSFFIFFRILFKKNRNKKEKFVMYLSSLSILALLSFKVVAVSITRASPFIFAFAILMGLAFSDERYSALKIFKIKKNYFLIFLAISSLVSFLILYSTPFHTAYVNPIMCPFFKEECSHFTYIGGHDAKKVGLYFEEVLKEDETFLPTGLYNFYTRHTDDILHWMFYSNFKKQTGKNPRLGDYLKYYQPEGRRVRYVLTDTKGVTNPEDLVGIGADQDILKKNYKPNDIIKIYDQDITYVYDLDNLIKKENIGGEEGFET